MIDLAKHDSQNSALSATFTLRWRWHGVTITGKILVGAEYFKHVNPRYWHSLGFLLVYI